MRIGQSTDIHPVVKDRPLVLGGVTIESELGCDGHSDADALTHVIAEAILGALALGDLGKHFPDTDPQYNGVSSIELLRHVVGLMNDRGYRLGNCDSLILIEKPKMAPFIESMRKNLANVCQVDVSAINVKATRGEKLGFVGRQEGVMAQAVVLLERKKQDE